MSGCVPAREQQSFCVSALRFRKEKKEESVSLSSAGKVFNNKSFRRFNFCDILNVPFDVSEGLQKPLHSVIRRRAVLCSL